MSGVTMILQARRGAIRAGVYSCSLQGPIPREGPLVGLAQAIDLSCTRRVGNLCIQRLSFGVVGSIRLAMACLPSCIQWADCCHKPRSQPTKQSGNETKTTNGENPGNMSTLVCTLCHESRSFQKIPSTLGYFDNILPQMFRKLVRYG